MSADNTDIKSFSFKKEERITSKKLIQELFSKGSSFYLYPFKVIWLAKPDQNTGHRQILISVPKRKFKRAVDRNLLKRRIREAYRLNKQIISPLQINKTFSIVYIYTTNKILPQNLISKKLISSLKKLEELV